MILAERLLQVFHWPAHYQIRLLLPGMVLLSVALHAAGLYLVRTTPPAREVALPPLPVHVSLLSGEAGAGVLLEARDPAWVEPGRMRDRLLPVPRPERKWSALQPALPGLEPSPADASPESWTPALPPLAQESFLEPRVRSSLPEVAPLSVRFDEGGPEVTADVMARLKLAAPARPPGAPTELLLVLDGSGVARHVWIVKSCGVPAVDAAARRAVQLARFGVSPEGYRGILRVNWAPVEAAKP